MIFPECRELFITLSSTTSDCITKSEFFLLLEVISSTQAYTELLILNVTHFCMEHNYDKVNLSNNLK